MRQSYPASCFNANENQYGSHACYHTASHPQSIMVPLVWRSLSSPWLDTASVAAVAGETRPVDDDTTRLGFAAFGNTCGIRIWSLEGDITGNGCHAGRDQSRRRNFDLGKKHRRSSLVACFLAGGANHRRGEKHALRSPARYSARSTTFSACRPRQAPNVLPLSLNLPSYGDHTPGYAYTLATPQLPEELTSLVRTEIRNQNQSVAFYSS